MWYVFWFSFSLLVTPTPIVLLKTSKSYTIYSNVCRTVQYCLFCAVLCTPWIIWGYCVGRCSRHNMVFQLCHPSQGWLRYDMTNALNITLLMADPDIQHQWGFWFVDKWNVATLLLPTSYQPTKTLRKWDCNCTPQLTSQQSAVGRQFV